MFKFRKSRAMSLLLSSLFCLSLAGCGSQSTSVDDYGSDTGEESSAEDGDDSGTSSRASLSEMLGGTELSYNNNFKLGSKQITVDVGYNTEGVESVSEYLVDSVQEEQFDEQSIVDSFFGDTEVACAKDYILTEENGDSVYTSIASQMIVYNNTSSGSAATSWTAEGAAWVDEATYFIHTYNGTYRNADYQLLISYSQGTNELVVVLYPLNVADLGGDPSIDNMDFSSFDGKYTSFYKNQAKAYDINDVMADRPNLCTMSEDQVLETAATSLKENLGIEFPVEAISMRSNLYGYVSSYSGDPQKCEILYFPESALGTDGFEGAVRNGYALSVLGSLDNLKVMTNTTSTYESAALYNNGFVGIDDQGIVALYITAKYTFKEKTAENVQVLSFNDAMDAFVNETPANLDLSNEKRLDNEVTFDVVQLVYYPVPKEGSTSECRLVPAWSLDTLNSNKDPIVRVLINAEDGSYITTIFKPEDE